MAETLAPQPPPNPSRPDVEVVFRHVTASGGAQETKEGH